MSVMVWHASFMVVLVKFMVNEFKFVDLSTDRFWRKHSEVILPCVKNSPNRQLLNNEISYLNSNIFFSLNYN